MRFTFPEDKSAKNGRERGMDFVDAQALWQDADRLERPARSLDEVRWQVIGRIRGKVWSAIVTYRENSIRIFSVRRARPQEERAYFDDRR